MEPSSCSFPDLAAPKNYITVINTYFGEAMFPSVIAFVVSIDADLLTIKNCDSHVRDKVEKYCS